MIILSLFCCASLCLNCLLIWYCRRLTKQFVFFAENVGELETVLDAFSSHLNGVHELEMFYGDETLGGLIKHSRDTVERIKSFYETFSLEEEEVEDPEDEGGEIDGSP